jgi:inosine triphosphate pyrophosphatase
VRAILSAGGHPIDIDSQSLESKSKVGLVTHRRLIKRVTAISVPEVQGTTQEVARAKCRAAAEMVFSSRCFKARSLMVPSFYEDRGRLHN